MLNFSFSHLQWIRYDCKGSSTRSNDTNISTKKNRTNCKCSIMSQGNSKMQFHFYAILLKSIRNCYANANAHIHTLAQSVSFSQREKLHQNLFSVLGACVFLFVEICSFIYVNIHFFVVIDCCDSHQIQWMHT